MSASDDWMARVNATAAAALRDRPPLERGDPVAWTEKYDKNTSGVSALHRYHEGTRTYCLHELPPRERHVDLGFPIALKACDHCERFCAARLSYPEIVSALAREAKEMSAA